MDTQHVKKWCSVSALNQDPMITGPHVGSFSLLCSSDKSTRNNNNWVREENLWYMDKHCYKLRATGENVWQTPRIGSTATSVSHPQTREEILNLPAVLLNAFLKRAWWCRMNYLATPRVCPCRSSLELILSVGAHWRQNTPCLSAKHAFTFKVNVGRLLCQGLTRKYEQVIRYLTKLFDFWFQDERDERQIQVIPHVHSK